MKNPNDPLHAELENAIKEYADVNARLAPLLAEAATKKATLLASLGEVIIQFVQEFGPLYESNHKTYWYRMMPCQEVALHHHGFQALIDEAFGPIDWLDLYRPALEALDRTKAIFPYGMGDCDVALCEKLTLEEKDAIMRYRHGIFS